MDSDRIGGVNFALGFIAFICIFLIDGWALSTLWNWFVSTAIGLPIIDFKQAIGILLVLSVCGVRDSNRKNIVTAFAFGPIAVAIGYGFKLLLGI